MQQWMTESKRVLANCAPAFGVLVDMRQLDLIDADVQNLFKVGQKMYRRHGMVRSAVILRHATMAVQFKRIALQSNIYDWERYIDANALDEWEQIALDWVVRGIDPDQRRTEIAERVRQKGIFS